jgi:hypothetical protein
MEIAMSWKCPICGTTENDDSTTKCLNCRQDFTEEALAEFNEKELLAGINGDVGNGTAERVDALLKQGKKRSEIEAILAENGIDNVEAVRIFDGVYTLHMETRFSAAKKQMIGGFCILAVGIAVTVVFYTVSQVFGIMIIATGAIFGGIVQIFRGFSKYTSA